MNRPSRNLWSDHPVMLLSIEPSFSPLAPPRVWILPSSLRGDMLYLGALHWWLTPAKDSKLVLQLLHHQDIITHLSRITPRPVTPPCWYFYFCLHLPQPFQRLKPLLTFRAQCLASSFPKAHPTLLRWSQPLLPGNYSPISSRLLCYFSTCRVISLVHLYMLRVLPGRKCPNTVYWAVKVNMDLGNFLTSPVKSSAF